MRRTALLFAVLALLPATADTEPRDCPADMVPTGLGTCVDRFEWPNRAGKRPLLGLSALPELRDEEAGRVMDAEALCRSVGKRVCYAQEWIAACEGPDRTRYPWGDRLKYKPGSRSAPCNVDRLYRSVDWRKVARRDPEHMAWLDQSEPAGERATCQSKRGAYDLTGNAEEWVRCRRGNGGYCLAGRFWSEPKSCRFLVDRHSPRWHGQTTAGRCCLGTLKE